MENNNNQNKYDENFEYAIDIVLTHEGGYINDPDDPGGETKYGISKCSYLTKEKKFRAGKFLDYK